MVSVRSTLEKGAIGVSGKVDARDSRSVLPAVEPNVTRCDAPKISHIALMSLSIDRSYEH